jgi:hypothetical protein
MCVIVYTKIKGKQLLLKNRDRGYSPNIEIIHELVNGIELVYIKDLKTGWIEGMNSNGLAIVQSTLNTGSDMSIDSNDKIFNALCETQQHKIVQKLLTLEGHILIIVNTKVFHIENNKKHYLIKPVHKPVAFTNHGHFFKSHGCVTGTTGLSSFIRKKLIDTELQKDVHYHDILNEVMNVNYTNIHPLFHAYRNKNKNFVNTTGQLLLNSTDNEFMYYKDVNNSGTVNYINKLPAHYFVKIKVVIKNTEKNKETKKIFTRKHLHHLGKKSSKYKHG